MRYTICRAAVKPVLNGEWDRPPFDRAETLVVALFHPQSSGHRPTTRVKALYDREGLYVFFRVQDRYVRCVQTERMAPVCTDSCCEFFVKPKAGKGYFNFEMNCGGTMLVNYITDPRRDELGRVHGETIHPELVGRMRVYHSMPKTVDPEIGDPVEWRIEYSIPFTLLESHVGPLGEVAGQTWRGNFYKCGDKTSHPHWASWAPIGDKLDFHQPERFASIVFET